MSKDSEDKCPGAYLWHSCSIARVTAPLRRSVPSSSELARVLNWAMVSCGSRSSRCGRKVFSSWIDARTY
eukprot:2354724-Pleurochrysis_carterae.AAC.1